MRTSALRVVTHPPSNIYPGFGPTCGSRRFHCFCKEVLVMDLGGSPTLPNARRGEKEWVATLAATHRLSVLLFPSFFATTLPCQSFLDTFFLARLQVKGVALNLLDDVFLLHLALETPQGIFQRFTLLDDDFSHFINSPPIRFGLVSCGASRRPSYARLCPAAGTAPVLIIACIRRFAGAP